MSFEIMKLSSSVRVACYRVLSALLLVSAYLCWWLVDVTAVNDSVWFNWSHGGALTCVVVSAWVAYRTRIPMKLQYPLLSAVPFTAALLVDWWLYYAQQSISVGMVWVLTGLGWLMILGSGFFLLPVNEED